MTAESEGRVAIIAGGTSGVGLATARRLAYEPSTRILLLGRDEVRGEDAVAQVKAAGAAGVEFLSTDMMDPQRAEHACDFALSTWGRIDVLVNTMSSTAMPKLVHDSPTADLAGVVNAQLNPVMHSCRAVLPAMRAQRSGVIVNVASDAAKVPTPGEAAIGAAMAAIVMFSKTLAVEAKRDGIRVNIVTPSIVAETAGYDRIMADPFTARLFEKAIKLAHLGVADADDLAALIEFLCGEGSAKITGQAISVNGGISAV